MKHYDQPYKNDALYFENCIMDLYNKLPEDEKAEIQISLNNIVKDVKRGRKLPLTANSLLIGIMSALYYLKYDESPVTTRVKTRIKEICMDPGKN